MRWRSHVAATAAAATYNLRGSSGHDLLCMVNVSYGGKTTMTTATECGDSHMGYRAGGGGRRQERLR